MVAKQSHRIKICIHRITFPNSNSMYALDDQLQFEYHISSCYQVTPTCKCMGIDAVFNQFGKVQYLAHSDLSYKVIYQVKLPVCVIIQLLQNECKYVFDNIQDVKETVLDQHTAFI